MIVPVTAKLSRLTSRHAVQAALDEFISVGRTAFLGRYGFGKSRDFLVRDPKTEQLCDSKAIVGAAYGYEHPTAGALRHDEFSGGEETVVPKLQQLRFEVVRVGEDWTAEEVQATVAAYFEMLRLEAQQTPYKKTEFNAALRGSLRGRSKASVELKFQNISAVLLGMELPFVAGYKPRSNAQLLLRKAVQQFVLDQPVLVGKIVDALEEVKTPEQKTFNAVVVAPPLMDEVARVEFSQPRLRLPRKIDFAARDESNRRLGRAGEQWAIEFEHRRLADTGLADLLQKVDWVSDRLGDGTGFDILSFDSPTRERFIEVKTTNGSIRSSFVISRNELDFSREAGDAYYLYRIFQFRESPSLYILQGDLKSQVHLEPIDYRASFRRMTS